MKSLVLIIYCVELRHNWLKPGVFVFGRVEKEISVIVERYWEEVIQICYTVSGNGHPKWTYKIMGVDKPKSQIICNVYGLKIWNNWNQKKNVKLCH